MINLYKYKADLESNKAFRDSEMHRLIQLRASACEDINLQNMCNLILTYIYDLNWQAISSENRKMRAN